MSGKSDDAGIAVLEAVHGDVLLLVHEHIQHVPVEADPEQGQETNGHISLSFTLGAVVNKHQKCHH